MEEALNILHTVCTAGYLYLPDIYEDGIATLAYPIRAAGGDDIVGVLTCPGSPSASRNRRPMACCSSWRKSPTNSATYRSQTSSDASASPPELDVASETVLRTSMELGGNAPFVIFEDAGIDAAVTGAMLARLRNMGEACTAANRFIVHEPIADEFAEKFAGKMKEMTTARGTESDSKLGPLIDAKSHDSVRELVMDAVASGAKAVVGGAPIEGLLPAHRPSGGP
jgi:hypothetical protein